MNARFAYLARPDKLLPMLHSQFRATYARTLRDLDAELRYLGAKEVIIQAGFAQDKIRLDGWPYLGARPEHPAVTLQFRNRQGDVMTFHAYKHRTFEENLRAIALTLDALRRVERYGIVEGEQYAGFKRIAAPGGSDSVRDAAERLAGFSDYTAAQILADRDVFLSAYRTAARILHPDVSSARDGWDELMRIKAHLEAHHGTRAPGVATP